MPHNAPIRVIWNDLTVPSIRDYTLFDNVNAKSINGDDGGTWNPKTQVGIAGAGLTLTTAASTIQGGVNTVRGGRLVHGDSDFFQLGGARTRSIVAPCWPYMVQAGSEWGFSSDFMCPISGTATGDQIMIPLTRLHNGATLSSVVMTYRVGANTLPSSPAAMMVFRSANDGTIATLSSTGTPTGEHQIGSIASLSAWYQGGKPQTSSYTCNQNNVIDTTAYTYFVQILDTGAIGRPKDNLLHSFTLNFTNIVDMRHE